MSPYGRHSELSRKVPPFLTPFSHKKDPNLDSECTPSHSDTPSIRSYLLSPLKTSRVTGVNWLVLPGQVLLLWEIVVHVMNNFTNKLAALCTPGRLCQEVRQVVICLNVGDKKFAHCNRFSDCMVANGIALFLKGRFRSGRVGHLRFVVPVNV